MQGVFVTMLSVRGILNLSKKQQKCERSPTKKALAGGRNKCKISATNLSGFVMMASLAYRVAIPIQILSTMQGITFQLVRQNFCDMSRPIYTSNAHQAVMCISQATQLNTGKHSLKSTARNTLNGSNLITQPQGAGLTTTSNFMSFSSQKSKS
jgi:hypothetical protein